MGGGGLFDDLWAQAGIPKPTVAPAPAPDPRTPVQRRVVGPGQVPPPVARGPTTSTPAPTPPPPGQVPPPQPAPGLLSKAGRLPGSLSGYDRYERGPGGIGWMDIQTQRPVTDKKLLAALNGQDPATVGGSGGGASGGSIPMLYKEPDRHGRTMRPYEEYTLPSGVTVVPEPKVNKYGTTYDLKIIDRPKAGNATPNATRVRDVGGKKVHERVNKDGIWEPDPAHAQPPAGVYPPGERKFENGKLWVADANGLLQAAPAHMQPPPGKYEPNEQVTRGGILWIADKDGILHMAPKEAQPDVQSRVRGGMTDPETARLEDRARRVADAEGEAKFMAARREERQAADARRVDIDYLGGLLEEGNLITNPTVKWWLPVAQAMEGFGLLGKETADKVTGTRVFQAISTQLQQQMKMSGVGAISDKDMVLFGRMIPTAEDSPEANRKMVAAMKQIDNYNRRVWEARQEYYDQGNSLKGWEKYRKAQPDLVSPFRRAKTGSDEWKALDVGELYVDVDDKGKERFYFKQNVPGQ